jgi:hypothetical protein
MFHLSTVEHNTLQTLEEIFILPEVGPHFALAGGTALALQIGHRMSVDFEDAEEDPDIIGFPPFDVNWMQVKEELLRKCI